MSEPKLLERVRTAIRLRHFSIRTEEAYTGIIRRFIVFHQMRHPRDMGVDEICEFLSDMAVTGKVAASTQNVAFNALLFLYREVLNINLPSIEGVERAKSPERRANLRPLCRVFRRCDWLRRGSESKRSLSR